MRRRLESWLPALVLVGFAAAAVVVSLLLTSAERRGVDALEESVAGEVRAIAGSQNQRFVNTFENAAGLSNGFGGEPFRLIERSPEDLQQLEELLELVTNARAGFYLLDADGTITQGVLFTGDPIGETFEWPGFDELKASPRFAAGGGVLPVSNGLTTNEPVTAFALPIREITPSGPGAVRGTFVFEQVVATDSPFNKEIGQLRRGETGIYYFYDNNGGVVASSDSSAIGRELADARLLTAPEGLHRFDDQVVAVADVPDAGWRVAFRQDIREFERALAGPLESVGRLLIFVLLAGGFGVTALLYRRLRAARAEQERLQLLSEAQSEFISIVSHELRTPVAGVLGFLETSLDHWELMDDGERKAAVTRAAANARRLQAMTRDVLDTQSVEAGQLTHTFECLDLSREVRDAVAAALELDAARTVELHLPEAAVWVDADGDRLRQVLANLLDNARKNSPAIERIDVTVTVGGSDAEVAIADRGPGIAEESLERIFDKFVRGRGDSVSGTGLGLYIAQQIIDAHGGRIWAESDPGQGATFRFTLPLAGVPATPQPDGDSVPA